MGDVTQSQFYEAMRELNDRIDRRHTTLRESMERGFDVLNAKLDAHVKDDQDVERRVTVIETRRDEEAKLSIKRGTWAGLLAAFGLTVAWEVLRTWVVHR